MRDLEAPPLRVGGQGRGQGRGQGWGQGRGQGSCTARGSAHDYHKPLHDYHEPLRGHVQHEAPQCPKLLP